MELYTKNLSSNSAASAVHLSWIEIGNLLPDQCEFGRYGRVEDWNVSLIGLDFLYLCLCDENMPKYLSLRVKENTYIRTKPPSQAYLYQESYVWPSLQKNVDPQAIQRCVS